MIAYSDPKAERRETAGVLDDYAFTVIACLDAYEATADLSYFRFAREIAEAMVEGFYDRVDGGFFDTCFGTFFEATGAAGESAGTATGAAGSGPGALGILGTRRKPFQDSPTPAGNTNEASYREQAERTLDVYSGVAAQHGMFAATYGLAVARFTAPHTQIIVVGEDVLAGELYRASVKRLSLNTAVVRLEASKAVAQNLPPALAETIPHLPALAGERSFAAVCSDFACQPPVFEAEELVRVLDARRRPAA